MLGYCATGKSGIETAPASMTMSASTQANTGLSIKNRDMECGLSGCLVLGAGQILSGLVERRGRAIGGERHLLGTDRRAGPGHLQPLDDQFVAVAKALGDQP